MADDYEGLIELHALVKHLLPTRVGKLCCCELVDDLQLARLTTSSSVEKSSCNTDGLMYGLRSISRFLYSWRIRDLKRVQAAYGPSRAQASRHAPEFPR